MPQYCTTALTWLCSPLHRLHVTEKLSRQQHSLQVQSSSSIETTRSQETETDRQSLHSTADLSSLLSFTGHLMRQYTLSMPAEWQGCVLSLTAALLLSMHSCATLLDSLAEEDSRG